MVGDMIGICILDRGADDPPTQGGMQTAQWVIRAGGHDWSGTAFSGDDAGEREDEHS